MAIATETIVKPDGFTGYLARPERAKDPLPAVVVIQEAWGVDAHIEDVTRRIAAAGYLALAPDLLTESGQRPPALARERMAEAVAFVNQAPPTLFADPAARAAALAGRPEAEAARIGETLEALLHRVFSPEKRRAQLDTVAAAVGYLRDERSETRGQKIAVVGFCLGGALATLLAARDPDLAAAVVFYGAPPPVDQVAKISCPVLGFYGGKDQRIMSQLPAFIEAMTAAGKRFEHHVYPDAGHAFFNDGRPPYDPVASRDAYARLLLFLRDSLS